MDQADLINLTPWQSLFWLIGLLLTGGGLTAAINAYVQRRKDADEHEIALRAQRHAEENEEIERLRAAIDQLRDEVKALHEENAELHASVAALKTTNMILIKLCRGALRDAGLDTGEIDVMGRPPQA